ncbi:hypothetical protein COO60DRAFT_1466585, partial [Scenedesmus sp. NREL 46B-D3]
MSARWARHEAAPYSRLVMHLGRLWDYCSSPEAQLKTWLARHLLAEANPRCAMWDGSAAGSAAPGAEGWSEGDRAAAVAAGLPALGPYSCSLADAVAAGLQALGPYSCSLADASARWLTQLLAGWCSCWRGAAAVWRAQ